jgi:hypothetical protein
MRMWMIDPKTLCRNHLLGEHRECHTLVGCLNHQKSIKGYLDKGFVDPRYVHMRHEILVQEMLRRGMCHKSPLDAFETIPLILFDTHPIIDVEFNLKDLHQRCAKCKALYYKE